ncbi:MAG: FAD:protein FMN transferase [Solirubrobacterales bacterium]
MRNEAERSFDLLGSRVRILIGAPTHAAAKPPELMALEVEALMRGFHRELSRFEPGSALSRMNASSDRDVVTGPLVAGLVLEAQRAATASGGLVDSAVIDQLERVGYESSLVGAKPADLQCALAVAPERRPARAASPGHWDDVDADPTQGRVSRPPGMRIDSGGIGKGLIADLTARRLRDYTSFAVDCGGDLHIGGRSAQARSVEIVHPFDDDAALFFDVVAGGVATSGLRTRIWRSGDSYFHHLIDPSTGLPAWTGIVQATAFAPTATRAEVLAKTALLSGPRMARRVLAPGGGALVLDSGEVELIGDMATSAPVLEGAA